MIRPALLVSLILAGGAFATPGPPVLQYYQGAEPELNKISEVLQGEAVYSEFDYATHKTAVILEDSKAGSLSFAKGQELPGYIDGRTEKYCYFDRRFRSALHINIPTPTWVCLMPGSGQSFVTRFLLSEEESLGRRKKLESPIPFEWAERPISSSTAAEVDKSRLFRTEIVYQGTAGGVLRLLYREFSNDMARPAFSQELTYDLPPDGSPLSISVKGARLEILEAGNSGLRYRVLLGFE